MPDRAGVAPRVALLLPLAMLLHVAEEWFWGFPAWTSTVLGDGVSNERFLLVNSVGIVLFVAGTGAAVRLSGAAWLAVAFATLLAVNGLLHALATLGWRLYSPGTVTGVLISVPLGVAVLRSSATRLRPPVFVAAVLVGLMIHGAATFVALR